MQLWELWKDWLRLDIALDPANIFQLLLLLVAAIVLSRLFGNSKSVNDGGPLYLNPVYWLIRNKGFAVFTAVSVFIALVGWMFFGGWPVFRLMAILSLGWLTIGLLTSFLRDKFWADSIAAALYLATVITSFAWADQSVAYLDQIKIEVGTYSITAWGGIAGAMAFIITLWICLGIASLIEQKIHRFPNLNSSLKVLIAKVIRILLIFLAIAITISSMGVDLTALTVFGGAIGLGLGFGLQKVVSNLVCGFILLTDRSIKPGDVVEIAGTYGWINNLKARYVSVITRDGTEHLIPNEDLVTQKVVNWSFTNNLVRFRTPVGISYNSDPHKAIELITAAALSVHRILKDPPPKVMLTGFGDSSVDLEVRCWIADPVNGVGNIRSEMLLKIWDTFKENNIEIPYPQRDLHIRSDSRVKEPETKD
jgi:small-conductance mechanosensitive channel